MSIQKKIQSLKSVDLHKIINDSAKEKEVFILKLNRIDQMWEKGIMDINKPRQRLKYATSTISRKKKKARFRKTDFITLRWFGDFYESMLLLFFKDKFIIQSDDLKWANWLEIQDRFENALGLTDKSMNLLKRILKPEIIKQLKRAI